MKNATLEFIFVLILMFVTLYGITTGIPYILEESDKSKNVYFATFVKYILLTMFILTLIGVSLMIRYGLSRPRKEIAETIDTVVKSI